MLSRLRLKTDTGPHYHIQHFHLDGEEQLIAFEAKRQLEECSHQTFEEYVENMKPIMKTSANDRYLRESIRTTTTENETKTIKTRPSLSASADNKHYQWRNNVNNVSMKNKPSFHKTHTKKFEKKENQPSTRRSINNITLGANLFFDQPIMLNDNSCKKVVHRNSIDSGRSKRPNNSGFYGTTYRSNATQPSFQKGVTMKRLHSSNKTRANTRLEQTERTLPPQPYSFNDTIANPKCSNLIKEFEEPKRPETYRVSPTKVSLRPEFIKLVMKIKEKQQKCNKQILHRAKKGRL